MITIESQFAFFDTPKVVSSVDRMRRRSLAQAGGFTRTTAKRSMRKRKKKSLPGQPPSSHSGELRRLLFFGHDRRRDSVVVGPLKFKSGNAPGALEHGGLTTVLRRNRKNKLVKHTVRIKPRPFMQPALVKTAPQFPGVFKNKLGSR